MTDYPELYRRLAQEIIKQDGKIDGDARAFVGRLVAKLQAEGWRIGPEAEAVLTDYLAGAQTAIRAAVTGALTTAAAAGLSMSSAAIADAAEAAFAERWPDGLTLSKRLWQWDKETRAGLTQVVRDAIRQGNSANQTIYAMQRLIERAGGGEKFKIVERHRDDWVTELWQSAQTVIHDPKAKAQWAATVKDIKRHIDQLETTGTRHAAERLFDQMRAAVKSGNGELAARAVHWWIYDKQLFHLKRIARTEMATAAHRAVIDDIGDNPGIIGFQWRLSASHPRPDICDYYANIDMGLGKGVWSKEAVPRHKAHPHCMCLLIPRATPIKTAGSHNYADFIRDVTPERREQLLPKWAQAALADGMPLERLIRADGLGLLTKIAATDLLNRQAVENIVAKLAEKAKNANGLADIWASPSSLAGHIEKRAQQGHAKDADDYYRQIKTALRSAGKLNFSADARFPLVEFVAGDWSVVLNHDGLVKTAYGFEKHLTTFTENQARKGYKVYDYDITTGLGKQLKKLFDSD